MGGQKLISFDLEADFGFFKKPDCNDGLVLSYNMLPKPVLLGILGAIAGLPGYGEKKEWPEYYRRLEGLPVGITPLAGRHEKGNFRKAIVKYTNTVGYANQDGNLLVEECMLIRPAFRCYLLLSDGNPDHDRLKENLREGKAVFIPYLGKNEFQAWFGNYREYEHTEFIPTGNFRIDSFFVKEGVIREKKVEFGFSLSVEGMTDGNSFGYFERLPIGFDTALMQYEMAEFVYTDWWLKPDTSIPGLCQLRREGEETVIQLF